jgi:MFS family permease
MMAAVTGPSDRAVKPRLLTPLFVLVTTASFAYFMSVGVLLPALPLYVKGPLGGGSLSVGIAVGSFSFAALVLRPWVGRLADRHGRRVLMVSGGLMAGLSVSVYGVATSLLPLGLLRLITGAGEALFFVAAVSAANDLAPDQRRGEAMSLFSLALYSGIGFGPVLGETVLGDDRFWAAWAVAAATSLLAALLGLAVGETRPASDEPDEPAPSRLLHRAALRPGTVLLMSVWGFSGFGAFVPLYARELGLGTSGFIFLAYAAVVLTIRSVGARIPDWLGAGVTSRTALACSAVGMATIGLWAAPAGLLVGTLLFGIGQGLAFPALISMALRAAPASERGAVVGTFTAFVDIAFGVGAVTLGTVADAVGYRGTFLVAAGVALCGLLVLLRQATR